jgi:hypothetical protein
MNPMISWSKVRLAETVHRPAYATGTPIARLLGTNPRTAEIRLVITITLRTRRVASIRRRYARGPEER